MKPSNSESRPGNPFNLSAASIQAIAISYSYFDVEHSSYHEEAPYYVVGYRRKFFRIIDGPNTIAVTADMDAAWSFVYLLRLVKKTQDITSLLKEVGIT